MIVNVLWFFLKMPWVGLQCEIVVFPDYTHLLFMVDIGAEYITVDSDCCFLRSKLIWIYIIFKTGHIQAQQDRGLRGNLSLSSLP